MSTTEKDVNRAFNKGLRQGKEQMKNTILKDIEKDIPWVGEKRMRELTQYVNAKYDEAAYNIQPKDKEEE